MEITLNREELKAWLASATAVTLLSISLVNDVVELWSNVSSPVVFYRALEKNPVFFGDGNYLVAYEENASERSLSFRDGNGGRSIFD